MEIEAFILLQRYRRDRHTLLEFVISSSNITDKSFDFSTVDLDTISVDYVLNCARSGEVLDFMEATRIYFDDFDYPIMTTSAHGDSFFLLSNPDVSGSPPRRPAPLVDVLKTPNNSYKGEKSTNLVVQKSERSRTKAKLGRNDETFASTQLVKDVNMLTLGLPEVPEGSPWTAEGLSDDNIQETAYEVLLASVTLSGKMPLFEEKIKEKSKYSVGLRFKKEGSNLHEQSENVHFNLLDIIRGQMEISETMDACIRQGLRRICLNMTYNQTDVPKISLELLSSISNSDFPNLKLYVKWLKRQAITLETLLQSSEKFDADEQMVLSLLLSQLTNVEEWVNAGPDGHAEILTCMKGFASRLSNSPLKFGIPLESYYWTHSYHFNIKLYEKLLGSVFDVLEDGEIIEEAEEIIKILKLTWPILGITQTLHDALYSWLLFQQFVSTGERALLQYAIFQLQQTKERKDNCGKEQCYINSLLCSVEVCGSRRTLNLIDTIFLNIFAWSSKQLEDYHLYFDQQRSGLLESVLTMAFLTGSCFADEYEGAMLLKPTEEVGAIFKLVRIFIERSIQAAYRRVLDYVESAAEREHTHPLVLLADELKMIAEKEFTSFIPVFCQRYPKAGEFSFILLHQFYGENLVPFLKEVEDFKESTRSVLAASDGLELYLLNGLNSLSRDGMGSFNISYLHPYQIRDISSPLILQWVNAQHDNIFEWTKRAILIENWEPLSSQQRQSTSIVEVFRIIEETVQQFFDLNLPMDIIHLRSLLIGIFRCLDTYLLHITTQQVDKSILFPSYPPLTRYKESLSSFTTKKSVEGMVSNEKVTEQLNHLTVSKLCVKLNTLLYIREQLDAIEDAIQHSWMTAQIVKRETFRAVMEEPSMSSELVDELFTIFDDLRKSAVDTSNIIFEFIGTRIIFWDMRDSYLSSLYRGNVEGARIENVVQQLDEVLDDICGLIVDTLRDQIVSSICKASMDGYVWVLLDGGPSRAFSETDVTLMQEDLNVLKDFFVADGEGLPHSEVEKESRLAQQILDLYATKVDKIIVMLRSASEHISYQTDAKRSGVRSIEDADTLLRVLCHKKDDDASEFLRLNYQLPKSSDYEDGIGVEPQSSMVPPVLSEMLKRNVTFNWAESGQRSFNLMKKKFLTT